jgi:DNA-binding NarL/FixJ family response regulator
MSHPRLEQESESHFLKANTSVFLGEPVSVLVVDDHALVRAAISQVLASQIEIELVISAQNYAEAEAQAAKRSPDIICLDMQVACSDSIAEIYRLRRLSPKSRIIAFSDVEDEQEGFAAIMAGAQGYWSKQDVDTDNIMTLIHSLCRGEFVLRPELLTRLMQRLRAAAMPLWGAESASGNRVLLGVGECKRLARLTTRECEVLQLISQGCRDRDIAAGLHISEKTVQKHVQSILSKLGAQNRTEAAYIIHRQSPS